MTAKPETYEGWTNRETWAFMLHVNNTEGLADQARSAIADTESWTLPAPDLALCDWAESLYTRAGYVSERGDSWPDLLADAAAGIGSLWRINWAECVEALTEE